MFATEQIATPTDWFFHEGRHVVVVHRRGRLRTMELEFEGGPSGRADPQVGDIWLIPADRRYCALAHGSTVEYCQMTLNPLFGNGIRSHIASSSRSAPWPDVRMPSLGYLPNG
ncbi:Putative transcriptional regulator, AraC family [Mycobacteroides abscessus subsp. abscessus]|nr:Putative transcriptional regulator, AraC family [Mycobacteroides abscessus subsp. abscessus]